jgi:glutaredoxin
MRPILCILPLLLVLPGASFGADRDCRRLEMFSRSDCPHCARAQLFLAEVRASRPDLEIEVYDIGIDVRARERLRELFAQQGVVAGGVPAFHLCGELVVGFANAESTGSRLLSRLSGPEAIAGSPFAVRAPILGLLEVERLGLPLFTVAVGLVDGFNPCAIWVLLILLSVLVNVRDRRKLVAIAGTFVLVSGLVYFAFMAAWLNIFLLIGWSRPTQVVLGCVAVAAGAIHVKDLVAFGRGPSLSIPERAKPGIYRHVREILRARSLGTAIAGAMLLALLVNVIELLCTAGLPAVYTQILTLRPLSNGAYYGYLALYNLAYIFDDALMVTIAVVTLDHLKLQERAGRFLKGLSGSVLIGLGVALLLRPDWLVV